MKLLEGKTAVITGAASARGLGKATAKLFAQHGARVAILDLDARAAQAAAADIGPSHIGVACNVTDKQACAHAAEVVLGVFGHVDILVNNAGITQPLKIMDIAPENYDADRVWCEAGNLWVRGWPASRVPGRKPRGAERNEES